MKSYVTQNRVDPRTQKTRVGRHLSKGHAQINVDPLLQVPVSIYTKNFLKAQAEILAQRGFVVFQYCDDNRSMRLLADLITKANVPYCKFKCDLGQMVYIGLCEQDSDDHKWFETVNGREYEISFPLTVKPTNYQIKQGKTL